jgi:hypothetical protein
MAGFKWIEGANTYDFELSGKVKKNGADFGSWGTTKDKICKLELKPTTGAKETLDAVWKFDKNQLCLFQKDKLIYNFHTNDTPKYLISDKSVLTFVPVAGQTFTFELRPEWDLTNKFDLSFTLNGASSVIDGFIDNNKSLFEYFFNDGSHMFRVTFAGGWEGQANEEGTDGEHFMHFKFDREDGTKDEFSLPATATFKKSINQFVYSFKKADGVQTSKITFAGVLNIGKNSRISYSIQAQKSNDGKDSVLSTELKMDAVIKTRKVEGGVEIAYALKKKNGDVSDNVLTIKGAFKFDKASLEIVFAYKANGKNRTITFGGKLTLGSDGSTISWVFEKDANGGIVFSVTLTDVVIKNATINSEFKITSQGGQVKAIEFIMGVTFKV